MYTKSLQNVAAKMFITSHNCPVCNLKNIFKKFFNITNILLKHYQNYYQNMTPHALTVASLLHKAEFAGRPVSRQSDDVEVLSSYTKKHTQVL